MKEDEIIIPKSDTIFSEGDIITVFYSTKDIEKVERLLEVGINYFWDYYQLSNKASDQRFVYIKQYFL